MIKNKNGFSFKYSTRDLANIAGETVWETFEEFARSYGRHRGPRYKFSIFERAFRTGPDNAEMNYQAAELKAWQNKMITGALNKIENEFPGLDFTKGKKDRIAKILRELVQTTGAEVLLKNNVIQSTGRGYLDSLEKLKDDKIKKAYLDGGTLTLIE